MGVNAANAPAGGLVAGGNPHVTKYDFEADAYGRISREPAPHDIDRWIIDQDNRLENVTIGY